MPDLESQIARWRHDMRASGLKSSSTLDELEDHLRDDIERRMRLGAGAQRAFEMSTESIGKPRTLRSEFQKLKLLETMSPSTHRRLQHTLVIIAMIAVFLGILLPILHKLGMYPPDHSTTHGTLGVGDVILLVVSAAICVGGYFCSKKFLLKA